MYREVEVTAAVSTTSSSSSSSSSSTGSNLLGNGSDETKATAPVQMIIIVTAWYKQYGTVVVL
jgi:hypothetical protein